MCMTYKCMKYIFLAVDFLFLEKLVFGLNFPQSLIEPNTMFGKIKGKRKENKLREGKERKWKKREKSHPSCWLGGKREKEIISFFLK